MDFKPIKPKKIYEEIVEQVKHFLTDGDLKPGDKLPSERELAEKLQVSRASVREALRSLEVMGFVDIRTGEGTFVSETLAGSIIQPLAMFMSIEGASIFEIYELRMIMESAAARLAAERATPQEIVSLEKALREMQGSIINSDQGEISDTAFHYAIAQATHNTWLVRLMTTISDSFHKTVSLSRTHLFMTPGNVGKLYAQHNKIFEAIRDKKPDEARLAMLEHLTYAEGEMEKITQD